MRVMTQQTLVLIKPDAVVRGIVGEIITRFEKPGLKIVGLKMLVPDKEIIDQHYPVGRREFIENLGQTTLDNNRELGINTREALGTEDAYEIGLQVQQWLNEFMRSGPVLALVLEGPQAISLVRKLRGFTLPSKAQPGTITGDYSFDSSSLANSTQRAIRNLVHASGNEVEAKFEINLWFKPDELHDYQTIHQQFMTQ